MLQLIAQGAPEAQIMEVQEKLAKAEAILGPAMEKLAAAEAEYQGLQLQVKILTSEWHRTDDPFKKAVLKTQIEARGGSVDGLSEEYLTKLDTLVGKLQDTNPQQKPKKFTKLAQQILDLVA